MFRITKICVCEKIRFLTFPKKVMRVFEVYIFWSWKNFEWYYFSHSEGKKEFCSEFCDSTVTITYFHFFRSLNVEEATHILWLLIGTSFASLTRNNLIIFLLWIRPIQSFSNQVNNGIKWKQQIENKLFSE